MAKYVKTDYVGGVDITAGKEYLVYRAHDDTCGWIHDDANYPICLYYRKCPHLNDHAWTVINR